MPQVQKPLGNLGIIQIDKLKTPNCTSHQTTPLSYPHPTAAAFRSSKRGSSTTAVPHSSSSQGPGTTTTHSSPRDCHPWTRSEERPKIPNESLIIFYFYFFLAHRRFAAQIAVEQEKSPNGILSPQYRAM